VFHPERTSQFRQVYLKYQATSHHRNASFEIDDSTITENGFVCLDTLPLNFTGNTFTLTSTDPLCVKVYSNDQTGHSFAVGFGQCFGKGWLHVVSEGWDRFRTEDAPMEYDKMLARALEHARSMDRAHSRSKHHDQVCIMQTRLRQLILRTSFSVWQSSRKNGVKYTYFHSLLVSYENIWETMALRSSTTSLCGDDLHLYWRSPDIPVYHTIPLTWPQMPMQTRRLTKLQLLCPSCLIVDRSVLLWIALIGGSTHSICYPCHHLEHTSISVSGAASWHVADNF